MVLLLFVTSQCLSLILIPFSKKTFNKYSHFGSGEWWRLVAFLMRIFHGTKIVVTGDELPERENVLIVPNHQQMTDIICIIVLALEHGSAGDTKWFVKDAVKFVPLLGWSMLFLNNLFVKRSWSRDQKMVEKTFSVIKRENIPLWLILFAEGTRITEEKLVVSKRILKKKNRRVNEHVMIPHTKGFAASIRGLGDHLDAVYDITIGYEGGIPSLWQFICGGTKRVHFHINRFEAKDLPTDAAELSSWLFDRFDNKDMLLDKFSKDSEFLAD